MSDEGRRLMLSAVAFLGVGLVVAVVAGIGTGLNLVLMALILGFQVVAVAVLTATRFRPVGFVIVWLAAIGAVLALIAPIDSFGLVTVLGAVFFGSCALALWLVGALIVRALLGRTGGSSLS